MLLTSVGMMNKDIESLKIYNCALNVETFERAPTSLFSFAHMGDLSRDCVVVWCVIILTSNLVPQIFESKISVQSLKTQNLIIPYVKF